MTQDYIYQLYQMRLLNNVLIFGNLSQSYDLYQNNKNDLSHRLQREFADLLGKTYRLL